VIGATNRREVVDDAILSRFGMELELTLPDEKNRMAILNQELAEAGFKARSPPTLRTLCRVCPAAIFRCWPSGWLVRVEDRAISFLSSVRSGLLPTPSLTTWPRGTALL
jgi:hypothetical protein